jgi:quercetin dioxygenase-like cupin family protein
MTHKLRTLVRSSLFCAAALCVSAATHSASAQEPGAARPTGPPELFRAALPDMPGKQLVVVALSIAPRAANQPASPGHRHPGSVYVYVTEGTARFGVEGQPVVEVKAGESFFEPPGALHTVMESTHPTERASAIAVMIVPDGAPLTLPAAQH